MMKLGRNALSDLSVFVDDEGKHIRWQHIKDLAELQDKEGLTFGNKLSSRNIIYHRHIMKVKTAAQTFSSSVADALQ